MTGLQNVTFVPRSKYNWGRLEIPTNALLFFKKGTVILKSKSKFN